MAAAGKNRRQIFYGGRMKRKKNLTTEENLYPDDDNRTIVNMNVEGMPWYEENKERESLEAKKAERAANNVHTDADELYGRNLRRYTVTATLTAMLLMLIFAGAMCLFIAFLCAIW